jgi:hypothetical protein
LVAFFFFFLVVFFFFFFTAFFFLAKRRFFLVARFLAVFRLVAVFLLTAFRLVLRFTAIALLLYLGVKPVRSGPVDRKGFRGTHNTTRSNGETAVYVRVGLSGMGFGGQSE